MDIILGLGEIAVTDSPEDIIKTFALSSCVGVTAYCPKKRTSGMIHIVLPICHENPVTKPAYYADTGIPLFIDMMESRGCRKDLMTINIFGGADSTRKDDCFKIGRHNLAMVKNLLYEMGIRYNLADVGGNVSRTLIMNAATGTVTVQRLPII